MKCLKHLSAAWPVLLWAAGKACAAELLANGGFEQNGGAGTSAFVSWTAQSQAGSQGGFYAQQGSQSAITPVAVPTPPAGSFTAMTDQPGPGGHVLYQDVALPTGLPIAFTGKVYVQNAARIAAAPASLDYTGAAPNQQVRIDVMDPAAGAFDTSAGVLKPLFAWPSTSEPSHAMADSAYQNIQADLSAFAGQTVRIRIAQTDNRQSLFVGLDALSVQQVQPLTTPAAPSQVAYFVQGGVLQLGFAPVSAPANDPVIAYNAQCTPVGGGAVVTGSAAVPPVIVTGLVPEQHYNCVVSASSASKTSPASAPLDVAAPAAASNAVVISDLQGKAVPIVLSNPAGGASSCALQTAHYSAANSLAELPPPGASAFPFGVVTLGVAQCQPGETVQLSFTMPSAIPAGARYWKYGPTPDNTTAHWYAFDGFSASGNTVTLMLTDGAVGDDDLLADGKISDPGGIVLATTGSASAKPVPVWSWQAWLAAMLALGGGLLLRRRQR